MKLRDRIKELRRVPASELIPNPKNWRTHPKEQQDALRGVLAEVGIAGAVLARELPSGELMLIDGHMRADTDPTAVWPVLVLDVSEAEADKLLATYDPISAMAETDAVKLDALLKEIDTGSEALQAMLAELADDAGLYQEEKEIVEDEVPEPPVDPVTKAGDLWLLGEHRLLCGDSTKAEDVGRLMAGERADLWLTDPPYNVALGMNETPEEAKKRNRRTDGKVVSNDSMSDTDFRAFLVAVFGVAFDFMKPGASFYIWHADSEGFNFRGAVIDCKQKTRQCLIWHKSSLCMGRQDYQWQHEPCLYGWKDGASHGWYSDRKQTTVLNYDKPSRSDDHPTMKPVALFAYQIGNSTAPQGLVIDTFLGSSTTIIAAEQLGRRCYGLELSPAYVDVGVLRWQKLTGKQAILEATGETFDQIKARASSASGASEIHSGAH